MSTRVAPSPTSAMRVTGGPIFRSMPASTTSTGFVTDEYLDLDIAMEAFKANEYDFRSENNSKRWATSYSGSIFDDGLVIVEKVAHSRPQGMQGFVFNLRREKFADPRVRQALALAFDFEWANQNLFYGQYVRSVSYFSQFGACCQRRPG